MKKHSQSITVRQSIAAGIVRYKVLSMKNYTDCLVGIVLFQDEIEKLIRNNVTVHIK